MLPKCDIGENQGQLQLAITKSIVYGDRSSENEIRCTIADKHTVHARDRPQDRASAAETGLDAETGLAAGTGLRCKPSIGQAGGQGEQGAGQDESRAGRVGLPLPFRRYGDLGEEQRFECLPVRRAKDDRD